MIADKKHNVNPSFAQIMYTDSTQIWRKSTICIIPNVITISAMIVSISTVLEYIVMIQVVTY